jgi:hypothetical protein
MFEDFYNFKQTPFSRTIPTDKLYKGNDSDEMNLPAAETAGYQVTCSLRSRAAELRGIKPEESNRTLEICRQTPVVRRADRRQRYGQNYDLAPFS